ncbi:MAG: J domain-containing protein [Candidatus Limnocylindrales bacterium]
MLTYQDTQIGTDLYKVLNVDPGADAEVIRAAYRALARRDHPDLSGDPAASSKMVELNAAFEVLSDVERRAAYDQLRRALAATTDTSPGRPVTPRAEGPAAGRTNNRQPLWERAAAQSQSGTVLEFGRYSGWSLADLARHDPDYLEWLARTMIGRPHQEEIDKLLALRRPRPLSVSTPARGRRGFFGRILG